MRERDRWSYRVREGGRLKERERESKLSIFSVKPFIIKSIKFYNIA